jgi:hypothetical protein
MFVSLAYRAGHILLGKQSHSYNDKSHLDHAHSLRSMMQAHEAMGASGPLLTVHGRKQHKMPV